MKKLFLLAVIAFTCNAIFAQNYKKQGDAKAAQGDYAGAAAMYEMGMEKDDECALSYFKLIYEKKIAPEYAEQSYRIILPLAQKGMAAAQFYLGAMYEQGNGVPQNSVSALEWFEKAAAKGNREAMERLDKIKEAARLAAEQKEREEQARIMAEQTTKGLRFAFGVKGGLNFANMNGTDFSPKTKTDFHIGALLNLRYGLKNKIQGFGLQPEVLFSRLGFVFDKQTCTFNYITIPIVLKAYVFNGLGIEAGPYFSYLLSASPESIHINNGPAIVLSGLKGGSDAGICVGATYQIPKGLFVGARYMLGFQPLANNLAWKNDAISISVGWMF